MNEHAVVIAGGGPTGMMLAAELTLAGTDVVVIERRATQELDGSRAGGLHARTLEVLDQRGVVDRFVTEGQVGQTNGFAYIPLDISDFPSRHNHGVALWQRDIERIMAGWIDELGVPYRWGVAVVDLTQDAAGVDIDLADGSGLRAQYVVGCDGGRSRVRKAADRLPRLRRGHELRHRPGPLREEPEVGVRHEGGALARSTGSTAATRMGSCCASLRRPHRRPHLR